MPISSFSCLKKNGVFIELNRKQSEYDHQDDAIVSSAFTRSPLHAIQFLIVYAGIDIIACFDPGVKRSKDFDSTMYIDIPTQSKDGTKITLLAQAPMPIDAFSWMLEKNQAVSAFSSFNHSWFAQNKNATPEKKEASQGCCLL